MLRLERPRPRLSWTRADGAQGAGGERASTHVVQGHRATAKRARRPPVSFEAGCRGFGNPKSVYGARPPCGFGCPARGCGVLVDGPRRLREQNPTIYVVIYVATFFVSYLGGFLAESGPRYQIPVKRFFNSLCYLRFNRTHP